MISKFGNHLFFATTLFTFLMGSAHAAKFANQFVEFEMPPKWQCNLEGSEWVCQNTDADKKRDAIIILAAKLRGDQDSLDQYLAFLKETKSYNSIKNKPVKSEPKYAKTLPINDQNWVDALHLESEIPGFYTRYLATVKQDIAVLVTYSINKNKYQQYLGDFDNLVKTLKVFRKAGGLNSNQGESLFSQAKVPPEFSASTVFPETVPGADTQAANAAPEEDDTWVYLGGAVLVFAVYVFLRRRRRTG